MPSIEVVPPVKVVLTPVEAQTFDVTVSAPNPVVQVVSEGPQGPPGADGDGTAYYGQVASQTSQTFTGLSQGVYVPMALSTFTLGDAFGFEADGFGLRNVSGSTQLVWAIGTVDSSTGNNRTTGLRLAVNGVGIPLSVCQATTGTQNFAKLMAQFLIEVPNNQTVSLQIANVTGAQDVTVQRAKLVLSTVGRQGEQGDAGEAGPPGATGEPGVVISPSEPADQDVLWADTSEQGDAVLPLGGLAGQSLVKVSGDDYDAQWADVEGLLPAGGAPGEVLVKSSATDYDFAFGRRHRIWTPVSGKSYGHISNVNASPSVGRLYFMPFLFPDTVTLNSIRAQVHIAGGAGSVVRLGIYLPDADGIPKSLLVDAGTINGTLLGVASISIDVTVSGLVYFACAAQVGANPALRAIQTANIPDYSGNAPTRDLNAREIYFQASVNGAFPSTTGTLDVSVFGFAMGVTAA